MSLLKELIILTVPEYIPVGLFGLLVGFVFSTNSLSVSLALILAIICVALVIAGYNSFNAIDDKEIDKINKPSRPLAKRTVTENQAFGASLTFFILAIIIGATINVFFLSIIILSIIMAIAYSFPKIHLKRRFGLGTLSATILYTVLFPLAGWAIKPITAIPLFLIAYLFLFGLGVSMLKDFEDIIGDRRYGARTPAVVLGPGITLNIIYGFYIFSAILLIVLIFTNFLQVKYALVLLLTTPALLNSYTLRGDITARTSKKVFLYGIMMLMSVELLFMTLSL